MREGGKRLVVAPPGPMQRQGVKSLTWVANLLDAIDEAGGEEGGGGWRLGRCGRGGVRSARRVLAASAWKATSQQQQLSHLGVFHAQQLFVTLRGVIISSLPLPLPCHALCPPCAVLCCAACN